ncbi:Zn-dependent hydrolase [Fodinicurvata sp. EGI_FJ10296]|uniref:Zn-dependent hydrolase n=1 Tax=Fodinicurvata sp. EGI_FJ10296 TaxID=3231908 RepID=UPI003453035C
MTSVEVTTLAPAIDIADALFRKIAARTPDPAGEGAGVSRPSFGEGEQIAHDLVRAIGTQHGLECHVDKVGSLHLTLPGRDRSAAPIVIGSHLDSVPQGGDYDGTAGVLLGLAVAIGLSRMEVVPPVDIVTLAIRAEESAWFDASYVGSRSALGLLSHDDARKIRRSDTGRSLADHMAEAGFDPSELDDTAPAIDPAKVGAFIEAHIEQGPLLIDRAVPLGLVSGIRGSLRYRTARCIGEYAHSGATPRHLRHDAVSATAALIEATNALWRQFEAAGEDLVFTVGKLHTDPAADAFSKVSGETTFTIDVRSLSTDTLDRFDAELQAAAQEIAKTHGVTIELGPKTGSTPAAIDGRMIEKLSSLAADLSIGTEIMPSGAGHDAAVFAGAGVPTAMIFIRNTHGSHNPDESMEMADFAEAARLVMAYCLAAK